MGHFYFLLGLAALLLVALILNLHRRFGRRGRLPYVADEALFSPPQRAFLAVLERALGADYRVYGRVRVAEVIGLRPRLDRAARRRAYARLANRQFDFLVCTTATGAIACAVNLAPRSRLGRPPPQDVLDRVCAAAGLPYVCLREADDYAPAELAQRVHAAIAALRPPPVRPVAPPRAAPRLAPGPAAGPAADFAADFAAGSESGPALDREVHHSLSEVSVDDAREPRLRPIRTGPRGTDPTAAGAPPAASAPPPAPPPADLFATGPRIEPTLVGDGDLDAGPTFHIDEGLEHEEDRRPRGRRP